MKRRWNKVRGDSWSLTEAEVWVSGEETGSANGGEEAGAHDLDGAEVG